MSTCLYSPITLLKQLMLAGLLLLATFELNAEVLEQIKNLTLVKKSGIEVLEMETLGSIYLVKGTRQARKGRVAITFAVTKDLKQITFGRVLDTETGDKVNIRKLPGKFKSEAHFTIGSGKRAYFVFTDPACPFCKKFEQQLAKSDLTERVTLHYFVYPILVDRQAFPMSRYILHQQTEAARIEALHAITFDNSLLYQRQSYTDEQLLQLDNQIDRARNIAIELGVQGTPTIITAEGKHLTWKRFFNEFK